MSARTAVRMDEAEVATFLDQQRTVICATLGPRGWPHLMPLWYVVRDGEVWGWTYAKSQKAVNLARDPRATLQVEAGARYGELRGVMLECDVEVHTHPDVVRELGFELAARYPEPTDTPEALRAMAAKRVALRFRERRRASWDHRKLEA